MVADPKSHKYRFLFLITILRLQGTTQSFDFTLTDEMKNEILTLYDVYVNGGGIRKSNLDGISLVEKTVVTKNGYPLK